MENLLLNKFSFNIPLYCPFEALLSLHNKIFSTFQQRFDCNKDDIIQNTLDCLKPLMLKICVFQDVDFFNLLIVLFLINLEFYYENAEYKVFGEYISRSFDIPDFFLWKSFILSYF